MPDYEELHEVGPHLVNPETAACTVCGIARALAERGYPCSGYVGARQDGRVGANGEGFA